VDYEEIDEPAQMELDEAVLVQLMRNYDVLMALLANTNPNAAEDLYEKHSSGKIVGPPPFLTT